MAEAAFGKYFNKSVKYLLHLHYSLTYFGSSDLNT